MQHWHAGRLMKVSHQSIDEVRILLIRWVNSYCRGFSRNHGWKREGHARPNLVFGVPMKIFSLKDSSQAAFIVLIVRMNPLFRNFAWPEIVTPNFEHPQNLISYGKQTKQCDDEILTLETKSRSRRGYTCGHDSQNGRSVSPSKHHDARRTQLMKGVEKAEWYVLRRCFVRSIEFILVFQWWADVRVYSFACCPEPWTKNFVCCVHCILHSTLEQSQRSFQIPFQSRTTKSWGGEKIDVAQTRTHVLGVSARRRRAGFSSWTEAANDIVLYDT